MNIEFEYREAQNLDEAVRAAFTAAGYAPDAGRADRLKMIEDGLAQAEATGDAESVSRCFLRDHQKVEYTVGAAKNSRFRQGSRDRNACTKGQ